MRSSLTWRRKHILANKRSAPHPGFSIKGNRNPQSAIKGLSISEFIVVGLKLQRCEMAILRVSIS